MGEHKEELMAESAAGTGSGPMTCASSQLLPWLRKDNEATRMPLKSAICFLVR